MRLAAWAPTIPLTRIYHALLAAFARFLEGALPPVEDEPKDRLSEALAAFLTAYESPLLHPAI